MLVKTLMLTYGLTLELSLFHLLAFVRQRGGQLLLKPGSGLTSRKGDPFLSDRITRDLVPEIDFDKVKLEQLDELRLDSPISWNLTLPYSSLLVEGLEPLDKAADASEQEGRLTDSLVTLAADVAAAQASVAELSAGLGSDALSLSETLVRLQRMSQAESYQEFYSIAGREFDGPSGLSIALESYRRAASLFDSVPLIIEARNYLDRMTFGQEHQQLRLSRDTLMARMDAASLLSNPALWQGIRGGLEGLRNSYAAAYGSFHFEYHQQALELRHLLETLEPQVKDLARFNEIPELGEAVGTDVQQLFKDVSEGYRLCSLAEEDLDFGVLPYCQWCILPMNVIIPHRNAEQLSGDVSRAMREYNRWLSTYSAAQILDKPTQQQVDKFIELVQVADPSALANILDDRVVEFLLQFLSPSD